MIPRIIHGNWFNPNMPSRLLAQCRASVVRLHPGWHIEFMIDKELDEFASQRAADKTNWESSGDGLVDSLEILDVEATEFVAMFSSVVLEDFYHLDKSLNVACYYDRLIQTVKRNGKYYYLSDFVRLLQLYCYGGFWLDFDMYCLQPLDKFRNDELVLAQIRDSLLAEALIGCEPQNPHIFALIKRMYETQTPEAGMVFMNLSGHALVEHNLKSYPKDYFIPHDRDQDESHNYDHTDDTHTIHCWRQKSYDIDRLEAIAVEVRAKHPAPEPEAKPLDALPAGCYQSKG